MLKKIVLTGFIVALSLATATMNGLSVAQAAQSDQGTPSSPAAAVSLGASVVEYETNAVTDWSLPLNLSRSGATTDPQLVIDSAGRYHALWRDAIDGFVYATGDGAAWSGLVVIEAPFVTRRYLPEEQVNAPTPAFTPYLVADAAGNLHAFWVDDSGPEASVLYYSGVPAGQFTTFDAWSPRQPLDNGAVAPSAALDSAGRLHLAYARTVEEGGRAAGIYYQRLDAGGMGTGATLLYSSRYLRSASAADANVQVTASDDGAVTVAWDDAGREQVFVAYSADGGRTWNPPQEIDRRAAEDGADAVGPGAIAMGGAATTRIVTWRAGHEPGRLCTQYYRVSSDGGRSWSLPRRLSDALAGCLDSAQFIAADGSLLLLGIIQSESTGGRSDQTAYLLAWDGGRWSEPQTEDLLSGFINPDTNQAVELRCLEAAARGNTISVIGCDRGTGGDVWWTSRIVGSPTAWFPPPSAWLGPERIAATEEAIAGLVAVADASGSTHFLWHLNGGTDIYHTRWDGQGWSVASPVLTANSPVAELSVASGDGRLLATWRDGTGLHFAQAGTDRPAEWSAAVDLAGVAASAIAPTILAAANGDLLIAYAVPLNEQRGIFLLRSEDLGASWSAPVTVFNAEAAGWDMADRPQLAQTADGVLHALYLRRGLPPDAAPLDLGYSRSDTDGRVWSPVESDATAKAEWSRLLVAGRVLHRLWAETANDRTFIRHVYSPDSGLSWSEPQQIAGLPADQLPAAALDPLGRPQVVGWDSGRLLNWQWDGAGWRAGESLATVLLPTGRPAAAVDATGRLVVASGATAEGATEELYGMARPLDFPSGALPTPLPPVVTPAPTGTPAPSPTPLPTPTVVISGAQDGGPLSRLPGAGGRMGQLTIAIVPAALAVLLMVVVGVRAMRVGGRPK